MSVVKNIKQRTANDSFNTYPIGMNAEFITIPAGTANLYENNVNTDEGMNILKNYIDEQISIAKVNFFVNYIDIDNQVYNLRVYNDDTTNGQELKNVLRNIGTNESSTRAVVTSRDVNSLSIQELYAPNFKNAYDLFGASAETFPFVYVKNIDSITFLNVDSVSRLFYYQRKLNQVNLLKLGNSLSNTCEMFSQCHNLNLISNFDTSNVTDSSFMFFNCQNLTAIPNFNMENTMDTRSMFQNCRNLTDIPDLNTAKATNMMLMFQQAASLTNAPRINLASAEDTAEMFSQDYDLININNILNTMTNKIKNTSRMFEGCLRLNPDGYAIARNVLFQPNLVNTAYMFCTTNLDRVYLNQLFDGNEGRCNAAHMFDSCRNFTNCSAINGVWDAVFDMSYMFANCNKLNYINGFSANYVNGIRNMVYGCSALTNAAILNLANGLPHYNNITDSSKWNTLDYIGFTNNQMSVIANNPTVLNSVENKGWTVQKVKYELVYTYSNNPDTWLNYSLETTSVSSNAQALRNAYINKDIDTANIIKLNVINIPSVTNGYYLFANNGSNYNFSKMTNVEHLDMQDLQDASRLFYNDKNLINVFNINLGKLLDTSDMFSGCSNLINISNFDTSNVSTMGGMFEDCDNLTITPYFNTSNVINMWGMFYRCRNLTNIPNFNTSKVIDMTQMFSWCNVLIDNLNFNTSNVIRMYGTFRGCNQFKNTINLNTSKVSDIGFMYDNCKNLVNVFNFDTSNVTSINSIFRNCPKLSNQSIDNIAYSLPLYENIINGNPSINQYIGLTNTQINNMSINAKEAAEDKGWMVLPQIRIDYTYVNGINRVNKIYNIDTMTGEQQYQNLFNLFDSQLDVTNIINIKIISSDNKISNMYSLFDSMHQVININMQISTSGVTNMSDLFYDCWNLINVPNLNTIRVTSMTNMFTQCKNIVNIPNFNTSNVTNMYGMFDGCQNLKNISNLNTTKVINMASMFAVCGNLITIPIFNTSNVANMDSMFVFCSSLSQNSLQNIIISIPDRDQITGTTTTTNLQYIGLDANQINSLSTYYKQIAADKGWYVEGYEPKYTEMLVGTANTLGDITFDSSEEYPMTLTYDDMFGDYCLENTNQGKANTTSSATLTVSEELLNVFDPMFRFLVYYSSEPNYDSTRIYKNNELIYEYDGYNGTTSYLDTTFWLEVQAGDVLKFEYEKDISGDDGLDGCKIYISGWKNNKSYEVRYSTVDAPTTYITKFIPKEDN